MQHLYGINEYNQRHMAFIASNSSAGAQGKEPRPAGPTPPKMSDQEYNRTLANAFNDPDVAFKKIKAKRKKHLKSANLFSKGKRK